jgi:NOL1/NOP2/fmu family ribosome biogenesis protein
VHAINSRDLKVLGQKIEAQYGYTGDFKYVVFVTEERKYYVATREVEPYFDKKKIRIERIGVYFGQDLHGELRLSIEGSQMIGPHATRNVIELTPAQRDDWMLGKDVMLADELPQQFHIIRCGSDFLGSGKCKKGVLLNYVPKERYIGAAFTDDDFIA